MKNEYLEFAKTIAREAGEIMRCYYGTQPDSEFKADNSIVTVADKEINRHVIDRIREVYPDHDIDGEEESSLQGSDHVWVCDPIDGTVPFSIELPVSVFSLALVVDGEPVVGVVYHPVSDTMYTAVKGGGATLNGKPISVNKTPLDNTALLNVDWWSDAQYDTMSPMMAAARDRGFYFIMAGSTTHASVLVAHGGLVANVFAGTKGKHVDIAAAKVIVEEAGGKVTDLYGNNQRYDGDIKGAILSNGIAHDEIVEIMKESLSKEGES